MPSAWAIDNLSLSDRRAESVAFMLSQFYDVPAGESGHAGLWRGILKIDTQAAERGNRPRHPSAASPR